MDPGNPVRGAAWDWFHLSENCEEHWVPAWSKVCLKTLHYLPVSWCQHICRWCKIWHHKLPRVIQTWWNGGIRFLTCVRSSCAHRRFSHLCQSGKSTDWHTPITGLGNHSLPDRAYSQSYSCAGKGMRKQAKAARKSDPVTKSIFFNIPCVHIFRNGWFAVSWLLVYVCCFRQFAKRPLSVNYKLLQISSEFMQKCLEPPPPSVCIASHQL